MKRGIIVAVIFALSSCTLPTQAELITIEISGEVYEVYDPFSHLGGRININDTITGTYTYDSDTPAYTDGLVYGNVYIHSEPPYGMFLEVEGIKFETDPENVDFSIWIADDCPTYPDVYDYYSAASFKNLSSDNEITVGWIDFSLSDSSGQALSNMDLPLTAPALDDWESSTLQISEDIGFFPGDGFIIKSHITSAVPEPSTMALLGAGLVGVIIRKKRTDQ